MLDSIRVDFGIANSIENIYEKRFEVLMHSQLFLRTDFLLESNTYSKALTHWMSLRMTAKKKVKSITNDKQYAEKSQKKKKTTTK